MDNHRPGKKGKTELRLRGLTGHEAAAQVPSNAAQPCSVVKVLFRYRCRWSRLVRQGRRPFKDMHSCSKYPKHGQTCSKP